MTLRTKYDEIVSVDVMRIEGTINKRMKMIGHAPSIVWEMYRHQGYVHRFIQN